MTDADHAIDSPWATTVVLGDGDTAFIRPIAPDDQPALLEFHERQSSDSLYRRFFSAKPTLTDKELAHFTTVDMVDRVALVVEIRGEFVAWASYERWSGRNEAEAAFMVDDEHHGRGIATLLLEHLAAIARANGIERFTAEVLADNRGMLAVFAKAGWPLQRRFESGVVDLDWELATTEEFIDSVERREQRADSRAVARVLLPRAVAVVGASDRPGSIGRLLWEHVRSSVNVPVHPVNPRLEDLDGTRCFGSIADLPDDVSLAIVAVPPAALESTIDQCIEKRMRGAVIVTSLDGVHGPTIALDAVVARARRSGLRLIGPSSMGVAGLHPGHLIQASIVDVTLRPGGLALSLQSGTLGVSVLRRADELDLGVSWFISLGDKSDVSANDLLQFWEDDDHTTVVGLYTESFGNPGKFARIARRVSLTRPIVAVRTGSAADGTLGSTLYQQAGLIEVPTVADLLDTCRFLETQPILRGPRVAVITNSTSPGTLADAALEAAGLDPVPSAIGLDWSSGPDDYAAAVAEALTDDEIDGVLVLFAPPSPAAQTLVSGVVEATAAGAGKPVAAVMMGSRDGPVVPGGQVPNFWFPEQAAAVMGRSHGYAQWLDTEAAAAASEVRSVDPTRAAGIIDAAIESLDDATESVVEHELGLDDVRGLLDASGIRMPTSRRATPLDAVIVADEIGYPVAVKARERTGRTAGGGMALDLNDPSDVRDAVATMYASLGDGAHDLVVQAMVDPGLTVRVRCTRDDALGPVLDVGYGGLDADVIGDRTTRVAPVSPASASAMLHETRVGAALDDTRADTSPLVDLIVSASHLAAQHPRVSEIDLNPVVVTDGNAIVTDARITVTSSAPTAGPLRRLG
ncbi:MAG: GNAT family N-acetyltransferase [Actinomycetota bacterium]